MSNRYIKPGKKTVCLFHLYFIQMKPIPYGFIKSTQSYTEQLSIEIFMIMLGG